MNILHVLSQLLGQNAGHPQAGQSQPQLQHIPDNRGTGFRPQQMQHMQPMAHRGQLHVQPHQGAYGDVGQGNQFVNADQFPQLNQGGQFNPGATPLQNSGYGPQGNPQQQAFQGTPDMYQRNPQNPFSVY